MSVLAVTHVTSGPNTGATTTTVMHESIRASMQPASNADVIRHGLDTDQPTYWVRFAESPPAKGDAVIWRAQAYRVAAISEGVNIDTELLAQLDHALTGATVDASVITGDATRVAASGAA